jgi:hypothetical protein
MAYRRQNLGMSPRIVRDHGDHHVVQPDLDEAAQEEEV